jgi:hypothetical protein
MTLLRFNIACGSLMRFDEVALPAAWLLVDGHLLRHQRLIGSATFDRVGL